MMSRIIKILYVSAEISPYANAGGLGEVARGFPRALCQEESVEVRRVMPLYKQVNKELTYLCDYPVCMEKSYESCVLKVDSYDKRIPTYFIGNARYFYRDHIYAYEDDGARFFFFCKAVVRMLEEINYVPDIIHLNDWHTGFLPILLKNMYPKIKTVFTIHNISYHGFIPYSYLSNLLYDKEAKELGYPEDLNFMKAGILYSDIVTTVSPGYANEIMMAPKDTGMEEVLKQCSSPIIPILNGIEIDSYNPGKVGEIAYPYDINTLEEKKKNRSLLRKELGLIDTKKPLVAMVTRLEYEKGIDLVIKAISYLDMSALQLVILGSGKSYYQGMLEEISKGYRESMVYISDYDSGLAKKIYAAADIYLMPSKYEPCGLGQLYAMRYGAIPIVNPVGGLRDTVIFQEEEPEISSGFYMEEWTGESLYKSIRLAVRTYYTKSWECMMKNAMMFDSSWGRSVQGYYNLYRNLIME